MKENESKAQSSNLGVNWGVFIIIVTIFIFFLIMSFCFDLYKPFQTYIQCKWIVLFGVGFSFSLGIGHIITGLSHYHVRKSILKSFDFTGYKFASNGMPAWLTGLVERSFFTIIAAVAFKNGQSYSGLFTLIGAWLALKLAANWQREGNTCRRLQKGDEKPERKKLPMEMIAALTISALLLGFFSIVFALFGGFIIAYGLKG